MPHRLMCSMLGSQLVALFWEVVETLGGGAWPEEVGHWECTFQSYTWPLPPVHNEMKKLLGNHTLPPP
jgi:hypothetical protein